MQPPKAYFKEITGYGLVKIGFTQDVVEVPQMNIINNGTVFLNEISEKDPFYEIEIKEVPVMELFVLPGIEQNENLNFTWNATKHEAEELHI